MRVLGERYRLEQRIGVGGMSEVWRGHDNVLDRPVAVKLIAPHLAEAEAVVEQVRTEARSAARLAHPNVASVHDFGMSSVLPGQPAPYIVMELVEGETLADHLRAGPLDWQIAVRVCAEVAAALAAAHVHGIVHRDIKPANIILTPAGVKVLDFGIAALVGEPDSGLDGTIVGTPAFVAPERLEADTVTPATPAADVYALGVLLYLCLARRLPWTPSDLPGVPPNAIPPGVEAAPLPPVPGLPDEVAALCLQCISRDPAERPTSFAVALLLAEAVDAQVYVPLTGVAPLVREVAPGTAWEDQATDVFEAPGRHRADP
ncbi:MULTISPECIES: serine/threonine-protein kinase [Catenuloplanes]|uniref:non-specific serine/threonine protein kinase n=1 Tax=Catenuloplanes niger TaxID=587534 RepID=A0AAE3ZSS6_9ACTN|nr:serine/threonine-protein kinase [Catenuloplanes niger]MDR7324384.1 serine/threonine-protein kinase [Catenuloplanes niger]